MHSSAVSRFRYNEQARDENLLGIKPRAMERAKNFISAGGPSSSMLATSKHAHCTTEWKRKSDNHERNRDGGHEDVETWKFYMVLFIQSQILVPALYRHLTLDELWSVGGSTLLPMITRSCYGVNQLLVEVSSFRPRFVLKFLREFHRRDPRLENQVIQ